MLGYSFALATLGKLTFIAGVDYSSSADFNPSDGMVGLPSCSAAVPSGSALTSDCNSRFYSASINHSDGRCKNGDGYASSQKPSLWFRHRVIDAMSGKIASVYDQNNVVNPPVATNSSSIKPKQSSREVSASTWHSNLSILTIVLVLLVVLL